MICQLNVLVLVDNIISFSLGGSYAQKHSSKLWMPKASTTDYSAKFNSIKLLARPGMVAISIMR
jgi:hypothetical protein